MTTTTKPMPNPLKNLRAIRAGAWAKVLATPNDSPALPAALDLHRAAAAAVRKERDRQHAAFQSMATSGLDH